MDTTRARHLLHSLRSGNATEILAYGLGRFHTVRRGYSAGMGFLQEWRGEGGLEPLGPSLLAPIDPAVAARELAETAVYTGLALPAAAVDELFRMARESPLRHPGEQHPFRFDEVRAGRLPSGAPAVLAVVDAAKHPLVRRLVDDPQVYEIARRYLGYRPSNIKPRMMWSFVTECPDDVRRAASQTIDYHFDVHHFNFVYANYYLTATDARSGAHAMILGSHRDKPLGWVLRSARQTDASVLRHFGKARELIIEGPAGSGFIQDASCYHKALAPLDRERLMLQLRYF